MALQAVLLIPSVLALLGDNPMQSEFACHVGLGEKYFCRICYTCNPTIEEENSGPVDCTANSDTELNSSASDAITDNELGRGAGARGASRQTSAAKGARVKNKKKASKKKKPESLAQLIGRAQGFLKVCLSPIPTQIMLII